MCEAPILLERDGWVARLTLNRPEVGNAIDLTFARAMMDASIICDQDDSARCVLLTGAGRMFCAGGDIAAFTGAGEQIPALLKQLTTYMHVAVTRLARMRKPLVVAVNGAAAGAGCGLAMLGDIVLAAQSAKFRLAYAGIGLSPDCGTSWLLPRLVGLRRAQELMLTDQRISAEQAAGMGLVTRVVADAELAAEARATAHRLANTAVRALGRTRSLLFASGANSLEEHLEQEACAIVAGGRDDECREGLAAFGEKRAPRFTPPP